MINVEKLLESKRVEITIMDERVDKEFVKMFRKKYSLTQVALANILGVSKKTIEKWEQGANNVNGSSAVLIKLLNNNPELMSQVYSVKFDVEGPVEDEYRLIESKSIVATIPKIGKSTKSPVSFVPLVALF